MERGKELFSDLLNKELGKYLQFKFYCIDNNLDETDKAVKSKWNRDNKIKQLLDGNNN